MLRHRMRVISSPSISTRGVVILIFSMVSSLSSLSYYKPYDTVRLLVGSRQPFQGGQAAADLLGLDAVGQPDIALHPKGIAGHQQQVKFPGLAAERVGVGLQRLGEDIEGPARAL